MNDFTRRKRISVQQEKRAAEDVGGRTTAGSGAAKFSGGADVRKQGDLRIECKFTEKHFFILKLDELEKLNLQALKGGVEEPVFQFGFKRHTGSMDRYAVRPHIPHAEDNEILETTDRKRIRLHHADLQRAFLQTDEVAVGFERPNGSTAWFDILPWSSFLSSLEKEE